MPVLGYCWPQSVTAGEPVSVSLAGPSGAGEVEIVRDGADPDVVERRTIPVAPADLHDRAPEDGCDWPVALTVTPEESWRSGIYLVRVDGRAAAWFVVRAARPTPGAPLLKLATNTWNAYNDVGGRNLYTGAVAASFARPLAEGFLSKPAGPGERVVDEIGAYLAFTDEHDLSLWHGMAGWAGQERRFACWAERAGITLDYCVDADLDGSDRALLDDRGLLLCVGHDEYWTWGMRDAVEGFVAAGGNLAFLAGNAVYWQVRIEDGGRRMVAWKHRFTDDPLHGTADTHLTTTMWADPLVGRPEAALTGVSFTRGGYHGIHRSVPHGAGGYEVHRPGHWLLAGTGLERGDLLGAAERVVGYECDGCDLTLVGGVPEPTGADGCPPGFTVVATAPATPFDEDTTPLPVAPGGEYELVFHARRLLGDDSTDARDRLRNGHAVLGTWTAPGGGTVVTTGCTEWAYGLRDPAVDKITRTILERLARPAA